MDDCDEKIELTFACNVCNIVINQWAQKSNPQNVSAQTRTNFHNAENQEYGDTH